MPGRRSRGPAPVRCGKHHLVARSSQTCSCLRFPSSLICKQQQEFAPAAFHPLFAAVIMKASWSRTTTLRGMATMPNADEVDAYLCYHALEAVVDEAVNDAVLKQVAVRRTRISNVTASITRGTVGRYTCMRMSMCMCVCAGPVRAHRDDAHEAHRQIAAGWQRCPVRNRQSACTHAPSPKPATTSPDAERWSLACTQARAPARTRGESRSEACRCPTRRKPSVGSRCRERLSHTPFECACRQRKRRRRTPRRRPWLRRACTPPRSRARSSRGSSRSRSPTSPCRQRWRPCSRRRALLALCYSAAT